MIYLCLHYLWRGGERSSRPSVEGIGRMGAGLTVPGAVLTGWMGMNPTLRALAYKENEEKRRLAQKRKAHTEGSARSSVGV